VGPPVRAGVVERASEAPGASPAGIPPPERCAAPWRVTVAPDGGTTARTSDADSNPAAIANATACDRDRAPSNSQHRRTLVRTVSCDRPVTRAISRSVNPFATSRSASNWYGSNGPIRIDAVTTTPR